MCPFRSLAHHKRVLVYHPVSALFAHHLKPSRLSKAVKLRQLRTSPLGTNGFLSWKLTARVQLRTLLHRQWYVITLFAPFTAKDGLHSGLHYCCRASSPSTATHLRIASIAGHHDHQVSLAGGAICSSQGGVGACQKYPPKLGSQACRPKHSF